MPTYEYRCPKGHEFEKFQRITEPPAAQCPACGQEATRLLSGGAGLLFKGQGFYTTDYRSDSYRKAAESDTAGSKGESKGGESKGESKDGGSKGGGKPDAGSSGGSGSGSSKGSE